MEDSHVSSSTSSSLNNPCIVNLRPDIVPVEQDEGNSRDSIEEFLCEPSSSQPNPVHTTGAEYEEILGKPLSQKLSKMTDEEKESVVKKIKETKTWKSKYLQNRKGIRTFHRKINAEMKKMEQLQKKIQAEKEKIKAEKEGLYSAEKGLQETEVELKNFQKDVKRKIRFTKEIEKLKEEKEVLERNIRIHSKGTLKNKGKLLNKIIIENDLKKAVQIKLDFLQEVFEVVKEHNLLSATREEEVDNKIVDWKMNLALYEDSNIDEINALHDGEVVNKRTEEK